MYTGHRPGGKRLSLFFWVAVKSFHTTLMSRVCWAESLSRLYERIYIYNPPECIARYWPVAIE